VRKERIMFHFSGKKDSLEGSNHRHGAWAWGAGGGGRQGGRDTRVGHYRTIER
jgi:hypothetical protein